MTNTSIGSSLRYVFGISDGKLYRSVRVSIFIEMIWLRARLADDLVESIWSEGGAVRRRAMTNNSIDNGDDVFDSSDDD